MLILTGAGKSEHQTASFSFNSDNYRLTTIFCTIALKLAIVDSVNTYQIQEVGLVLFLLGLCVLSQTSRGYPPDENRRMFISYVNNSDIP